MSRAEQVKRIREERGGSMQEALSIYARKLRSELRTSLILQIREADDLLEVKLVVQKVIEELT